jgi:hypothetical protein
VTEDAPASRGEGSHETQPVVCRRDGFSSLGRGRGEFAVIDQSREGKDAGLQLRRNHARDLRQPACRNPVMAAMPLSARGLSMNVFVWRDGDQTKLRSTAPAVIAAHDLSDDPACGLAGVDALTGAVVDR